MEAMAHSMLSQIPQLWYTDQLMAPKLPALRGCMTWYAIRRAPRVFFGINKIRYEEWCLEKPQWLQTGLIFCDAFDNVRQLCMRPIGMSCLAMCALETMKRCRNEICSYAYVLPCTSHSR